MKIFIIGAGGFIGSCIAKYLSGKGHETREFVRSKDGNLSSEGIPENTDVIVNAAGRLGTPDVTNEDLILSNSELPGILGDCCSRRGIHLIHISTPGVTGLLPDASETLEYDPWGSYELSKMKGEMNLLEHDSLPSHLLTILRPDFVYGPGDLHKLALFRQVSKGWMPVIGRSGARIRPTFCGDVCRAVEASIPGGTLNGGLYNIGGPDVITVREFCNTIASALGSNFRAVPLPRAFFKLALLLGPLCPDALSASRLKLFGEDHYVSIKKAENSGFFPEYGIAEGIEKTVSWYRTTGILQ